MLNTNIKILPFALHNQYFVTFNLPLYFSPVIDLKFIRAGVDTLFNFVSPRPENIAAIDLQINKILQRSDEFVGNLEYENMQRLK